jgi:hypothetical protein
MGPVDARLAEINERECERVALTFTENRYRYKVTQGHIKEGTQCALR